MMMRIMELNEGEIDLSFIQTFYNEDINSQDMISIEMMFHYNVVFAASLDWVEHGVWAERTAEGFKGLAISIAQGSPLRGYYDSLEVISFGRTEAADQVANGKTAVIGKMADLNKSELMANEFKVADYLPNQGNPKENWKQNAGTLRSIMGFGQPIKDVSPYPMEKAGFLGAERNLLQNSGWTYTNGYWVP